MIYSEYAFMDYVCDEQLREIKSIKETLNLGAHGSHGVHSLQPECGLAPHIRAFLEPQVGSDEDTMGLSHFSSTVGRKWCLGCTAVEWVFLQF